MGYIIVQIHNKEEKTMKKIISIILLSCIFATMSVSSYAKDNVCGEVLNTDIKAYINGNPIKSYNINGWTGIKAEDLREYGFNVEWDADERSLSIIKNPIEKCTSNYQFEHNNYPVGSHAAYVYKTDIKTFLEGKPVSSFNIGGWTIIYIDELQIYGDVIWDPQKREISYRSSIPWQINIMPYYILSQEHSIGNGDDYMIKSINGSFTKKNDTFYAVGENLSHINEVKLTYDKEQGGLIFSFSMTGQHLIYDEYLSDLCNNMITVEHGSKVQKFPTFVNEHVRICINEVIVPICEVWQNKGNNNKDFYFLLDFEIEQDAVNNITLDIF